MNNDDKTHINSLDENDQYLLLYKKVCQSVTKGAFSDVKPVDRTVWDGQALWAFCTSKNGGFIRSLNERTNPPKYGTLKNMASRGNTRENYAEIIIKTCIQVTPYQNLRQFLDQYIIFCSEHVTFELEKVKAFKGFDDLIKKVLERREIEKAIEAREKSEDFPEEDAIDLISPFKSLNHFDFDDAKHFFGRKKETEAIVKSINDVAFYALMGISGTGKSSLALAGVAHALVQTNEWQYVSFRVTSYEHNPFKSLSLALLQIHSPDLEGHEQKEYIKNIVSEMLLEEGYKSLLEEIRFIRARKEFEGKRLLIVIDQFEELFTSEIDEVDRKRFLELLVNVQNELQDIENGCKPAACILITIRSDFQEQYSIYPGFTNLISDNHHHMIIPPISNRDAIADIIRLPLKDDAVKYEEGLTAQLVEDAVLAIDKSGHKNIIPLLQYTLSQLWENKNTVEITREYYFKNGGIFGTLPNKADEFMSSQKDENSIKDIFLRLVSWVKTSDNGKFTRKLASRSNFNDEEWNSIKILAGENYRLLTIAGSQAEGNTDTTVEISHDSLLSEWDQLGSWLVDEDEFIQWRNQLDNKISDWIEHKYSEDYLFAKPYVEEAIRWKDERKLSDDEIDFISKSKAYIKKRRRRTKVFILSTLTMLSSVVFSFLYSLHVSNTTILIKNKRLLAEMSNTFLEKGDARLAILLASEALRDNYKEGERDEISFNNAMSTYFRSNGKYMVKERYHVPELNGRGVYAVAKDLERLVYENFDSEISVWDLKNDKLIFNLNGSPELINDIKMNDSGNEFFLRSHHSRNAQVWDINLKNKILDLRGRDIREILLSDDSMYYMAEDFQGYSTLGYIDPDTKEVEEIFTSQAPGRIGLSQSGCCFYHVDGGRFEVYSLMKNEFEKVKTISGSPADEFFFSLDQKYIFSIGSDGSSKFSTVEDYILTGELDDVYDPKKKLSEGDQYLFSRDGNFLGVYEINYDYEVGSENFHVFNIPSGAYVNSFPWGDVDRTETRFEASSMLGQVAIPIDDLGSSEQIFFELISEDKISVRALSDGYPAYLENFRFINGTSLLTAIDRESEILYVFDKISIPDQAMKFSNSDNYNSRFRISGDVVKSDFYSLSGVRSSLWSSSWDLRSGEFLGYDFSPAPLLFDFDYDPDGGNSYGDCDILPYEFVHVKPGCHIVSHHENLSMKIVSTKYSFDFVIMKGNREAKSFSVPYSLSAYMAVSEDDNYFILISKEEALVWDLRDLSNVSSWSWDLEEEGVLFDAAYPTDYFMDIYDYLGDGKVILRIFNNQYTITIVGNYNIITYDIVSGKPISSFSTREVPTMINGFKGSHLMAVLGKSRMFIADIYSGDIALDYRSSFTSIKSIDMTEDALSVLFTVKSGEAYLVPINSLSNNEIIKAVENLDFPGFTKNERERFNLD